MDSRYSTYVDGKFVEVPPMEQLCAALKEKFSQQERENERLREENKKLKEGIWEKEEVARLKQQHKEMQEDYFRGFPISKEEMEAINKWKKQTYGEKRNYGPIGGAFIYKFLPTSIGVAGTILGPDGQKFEFQHLG